MHTVARALIKNSKIFLIKNGRLEISNINNYKGETEKQKDLRLKNIISKMAYMNPTISTIALNGRDYQTGSITTNYMLSTKEILQNQRQKRLEVKEWETIYHGNSSYKKVGLAMLISGKTDNNYQKQ